MRQDRLSTFLNVKVSLGVGKFHDAYLFILLVYCTSKPDSPLRLAYYPVWLKRVVLDVGGYT
jgi:hypothetical protein